MRKVLWFCAGLALLTGVGVYLASDYVHDHPESMFGRGVVTLYRAGSFINPFGSSTPKQVATAPRTFSGTTKLATEPTDEQIEQVRLAITEAMQSELPSVKLLGTIILPDPIETPEPVVYGDEIDVPEPMERLIVEVPLTMPNLAEVIEAFGFPVPAYPEGHGCTQPMVCPWNGRCYQSKVVTGPCETPEDEMVPAIVDHCETTDEEIMKAILGVPVMTGFGEELSEPMEELKEKPPLPNQSCEEACPHVGPRQIVCPFSGKVYPLDLRPCEPMTPLPELKVEEAQEEPASKSDKKPELIKKLNIKPRLMPKVGAVTPKQGNDTLEFRPSDLQPNEFGVIPF